MTKTIILLIAFIVFSCSEPNRFQSIVVENDRSDKVDLLQKEFTVYFSNGDSTKYSFSLANEEIRRLEELYHINNVESLGDTALIRNNMNLTMPATATVITLKFIDRSTQIITIQEDATHNPLLLKKYKKTKAFVDALHDIISSKPEIMGAQKSDIRYF